MSYSGINIHAQMPILIPEHLIILFFKKIKRFKNIILFNLHENQLLTNLASLPVIMKIVFLLSLVR